MHRLVEGDEIADVLEPYARVELRLAHAALDGSTLFLRYERDHDDA